MKIEFCIYKNQVLGLKLTFFETDNSKFVSFSTFIYEVNTIYSWTIWIIMCYGNVQEYIIQYAHSFFPEDF